MIQTLKKILLLPLFLLGTAYAKDKQAEMPPLDPSWQGEHAMALVNQGASIFAVSIPSYSKPHSVQIVYKLDNKDLALLSLVRDAQVVTIKTKPFNIEQLMRGDEVNVIADVYDGHFQEGGSMLYEATTLVFADKLYVRELKDLAPATQFQEYDYIELAENTRLYIHKIQQKPSFNHILAVEMTGVCPLKLRTSKRVPSEAELMRHFFNCGSLKPLFYDTYQLQ
ncbi:hypothetical protein ACFOEE_04425 [Pseudoalteromonas fenneropenaei]|uniref:Uncharacterized protein n=1 Tax=Pseudoalteromonas fenneropenaei TaxID=1737459 RepID=A0ABV7CGI9_9GAMM